MHDRVTQFPSHDANNGPES